MARDNKSKVAALPATCNHATLEPAEAQF